jgi:dipeptidyl-peptidase-4
VIRRLATALLLTLLTSRAGADEFLRRYAETRGFSLGRPVSPRPTPDGKSVLFLRSAAREAVQALYELDVASGKTRTLLTAADLLKGGDEKMSVEERARRERMRMSTRGLSGFQLSEDGARLLIPLSGRLFVYERASQKVDDLAAGAEAHLSPDGKRVAYVRDRDVFVMELATKKETRLTKSASAKISYGSPEFVAQEEMDRFDGMWWSPDSRALAVEEVDAAPVEVFHLMDLLRPESEPDAVPYPRAGTANVKVRLGVVAASGGAMRFVEWDAAKLPYLASVRWKDGPLTIAVEDRVQQNLELRRVDEKSGKTTLLLSEHDDAWLDLDQSVPRWLADGSAFLWSSERSGSRALELRDAQGTLLHAFADLGYDDLLHLHGRVAWIRTADALDTQVAMLPLAADAHPKALTQGAAQHDATISEDGTLAVIRTSGTDAPTRWEVLRDGKPAGVLPSVAEDPPFVPKQEFFVVGERKLNAVVVKPRKFAAGKKWPVLLDVYGGPHHQQVTHALRQSLLRQWYADRGFVVVAIDGRGTPHRGRAWERAIRGDFTVTLDDQVDGLKALGAKLPYLDLKRVGVFGWSFGGYLAALATLARGDVFAVGVAGAPVVDWRDYDTFYTERYLGLPDADKAAYDKSSLLTYAGKLERPLLIVHGTRDDNVYFMNSLKLADALFRAGKRFSLLPLSGLTHMVPEPTVIERLHERIAAELGAVLLK